MKKSLLTIALIAFTLIGGTRPAFSDETGTPMTDAENQVLDTVLSMTTAFQNRDIEAVLAHYKDDAVINFEPGNPTSGTADIREQFTQFFAINPVFDYGGHKVIVTGDTALHIAPWDMNGTAPDGTKISDSGLSVAVLKRQADASWRIVVDDPYGALVAQ